jgi:hypothetical protein
MSFHMMQQLPKINDATLLKRALATLKYALTEHEQPVAVRGYGRETLETRCELVLLREKTGLGADIGFHREQDGSFTLVSDSYAIENLPEIMASLKRTYEEEKAIARAHTMGYRVASRGKWIQRGEEQFLQLRLTR